MQQVLTNIGAYIVARQCLAVQNTDAAAAINGTAIDRLAAGNNAALSALFVASVGAVTGAPSAQSHVFTVEHSADNVTYVPFLDLDGNEQAITITADNTTTSLAVDLSRANRYVRLTYDDSSAFTGGTTPANDIAAVALLGGGDTLPMG